MLLVLGPIFGTLGAMLGVAVGTEEPRAFLDVVAILQHSDVQAVTLMSSFAAGLASLAALGAGQARGRPFHALKAGTALAAVLFLFPGMPLGVLLAAAGC